MAVNFRLVKYKDGDYKLAGNVFARSVHLNTVSTDELAEIMQSNCTVKTSDIRAVLSEMVEVMRLQMQQGKVVRLAGIGSFRLGIRSGTVKQQKDYDAAKDIHGYRVVFRPEKRMKAGKAVYPLLQGTKLKELTLGTTPGEATASVASGV